MKTIEIKKILVPIDFSKTSEAATLAAIKLAVLLKAEIYLLHVVEDNNYQFSVIPEIQFKVMPTIPQIEFAVKEKMANIQNELQEKYGIGVQVYVNTGSVNTEIIGFAKSLHINLIVMGTHGVSGYKEFFIGSNAQRVTTLSEIPVLTIQEGAVNKFKNILIPIDNSLHSREKVNIAMIMANLFGAKIHLIGLPDSDDKQEVKEINIKLKSVEKIIKSDNFSFKTTVVHGKSLAKTALNYATDNKCDLIVINTGHESDITGVFLGAFAQQIVNHSKIPVLTFKHTDGHYSIDTEGYGIG